MCVRYHKFSAKSAGKGAAPQPTTTEQAHAARITALRHVACISSHALGAAMPSGRPCPPPGAWRWRLSLGPGPKPKPKRSNPEPSRALRQRPERALAPLEATGGHSRRLLAACPGAWGPQPLGTAPPVAGSSAAAAAAAAASSAPITLRFSPLLPWPVQVLSPVRYLVVSSLGAPTTSVSATTSTIYPACCSPADRALRLQLLRLLPLRLALLPLRSALVSHAPRVRQPPSVVSICAPRLERVLITRGDGGPHIKTAGPFPNVFSGSRPSLRDRFLPTHLPRFRARSARPTLPLLLALERPFCPATCEEKGCAGRSPIYPPH
jgi:hypothetical protein